MSNTPNGDRLNNILFGRPVVRPKTEAGVAFRDNYFFKKANVVLGALGLDWDSAALMADRAAEDDDIEAFANMFGEDGPPRPASESESEKR